MNRYDATYDPATKRSGRIGKRQIIPKACTRLTFWQQCSSWLGTTRSIPPTAATEPSWPWSAYGCNVRVRSWRRLTIHAWVTQCLPHSELHSPVLIGG